MVRKQQMHDDTTAFLFLAARVGTTEVVNTIRKLVQTGTQLPVTSTDDKGCTILFKAVTFGHVELVRLLLDAGASPHTANSAGITPLMVAVGADRDDVLRLLAEADAKLEATSKNNFVCATRNIYQREEDYTPAGLLFKAVAAGHFERVQQLMKAGVSPNTTDSPTPHQADVTPLMAAAAAGHADVLWLLLEVGAKLEATTNHGATALLMAAVVGHAEVVLLLLEAGANPDTADSRGVTPLMASVAGDLQRNMEIQFHPYAASSRTTARSSSLCVELLLEAGASIEAVDERGKTALDRAARGGDLRCVFALTKAGASLHTPNRWGPLINAFATAGAEMAALEEEEKAARATVTTTRDIIRELLAEQGRQNFPLISAARNGCVVMVRAMLKRYSYPDVVDSLGNTALIWAARYGHVETVELLLDAGANPDVANNLEGLTALIWSARNGHIEVVKLLLAAGATRDIADSKRMTALAWAEAQDHDKIAECLTMDKVRGGGDGNNREPSNRYDGGWVYRLRRRLSEDAAAVYQRLLERRSSQDSASLSWSSVGSTRSSMTSRPSQEPPVACAATPSAHPPPPGRLDAPPPVSGGFDPLVAPNPLLAACKSASAAPRSASAAAGSGNATIAAMSTQHPEAAGGSSN